MITPWQFAYQWFNNIWSYLWGIQIPLINMSFGEFGLSLMLFSLITLAIVRKLKGGN